MSALPIPGKIGWRTKLKFVVVYPSEYDIITGSTPVEYILGVVDKVSIDGIGYAHEDINGITNWGLGKQTKPPGNKTGKVLVAETEWCYKLLRWLAATDSRFDIKIVELEQTQNPGYGQWVAGQEAVIGCFVDPISKDYSIGDMPYATFPFNWTEFKFVEGSAPFYIGSGIFMAGVKPTKT